MLTSGNNIELKSVMNGLNEIIKDYIESPSTDYAIMICGVWGCGKSFYIHHDFKDLVKTVTVPKKEGKQKEKTYNPAFISRRAARRVLAAMRARTRAVTRRLMAVRPAQDRTLVVMRPVVRLVAVRILLWG